MTKIHLDTDIGGDMDDVCALAMLLKSRSRDHWRDDRLRRCREARWLCPLRPRPYGAF